MTCYVFCAPTARGFKKQLSVCCVLLCMTQRGEALPCVCNAPYARPAGNTELGVPATVIAAAASRRICATTHEAPVLVSCGSSRPSLLVCFRMLSKITTRGALGVSCLVRCAKARPPFRNFFNPRTFPFTFSPSSQSTQVLCIPVLRFLFLFFGTALLPWLLVSIQSDKRGHQR